MAEFRKDIKRVELLHHYDTQHTTARDELSFAYQYLSFYISLIGAIIGATLLGYLNLAEGDRRGLALLAGPAMTVILGRLGSQTVNVFYRRFAEAWVSEMNIASLLGLYEAATWTSVKPRFPSSRGGGPLTSPLHPDIAKEFERAARESWPAESLAHEIVQWRLSPTLRYAKLTFWAYEIIGVVVAVGIVVTFA
jgi:hypothetical protein